MGCRFWLSWQYVGFVATICLLQNAQLASAFQINQRPGAPRPRRSAIIRSASAQCTTDANADDATRFYSRGEMPDRTASAFTKVRSARRRRVCFQTLALTCGCFAVAAPHLSAAKAAAATSTSASTEPSDPAAILASIREAEATLQKLLDNWSDAVVDCTFADVPRELLESRNKEQLLEKASTNALFDKSVSVVSCKLTNRVVRDYIGSTGKGPLVGIDRQLRKALDVFEIDDLDGYLQTVEDVQHSLAKAVSYSYSAGSSDFASLNNFKPEDEDKVLANSSNYQECRTSIQEAVSGLQKVVAILAR